MVAACRIWCLVFKLSLRCGAEGYVSGLRAAVAAGATVTTLNCASSCSCDVSYCWRIVD